MTLFDNSCEEIPETLRTTLVLQCRQLDHLKVIFQEAGILIKKSWRHTSLKEDVPQKCQIIELVKLYSEAILWFLNAGLLPEKSMFPVQELETLYTSKRQNLQSKIKHWLFENHLDAKEIGSVSLLIDSLCQQLGAQLIVSEFKCF